nr:kirola-like [Coffea arabica]
MSLAGKLVNQIEIKSDGDVFHEIFRYRPHDISTMSPSNVQGCDLHGDGKEKVAKVVIEAIDEAKKSITFKMIEGDLMEFYKTFIATVHVEALGQSCLVAWTIEYEKRSENVPDPNTLMELALNITKDIETHQLK